MATDTKIDSLYDGQKVIARFARRDTEDGTAPDWSEPKEVTLVVRRRDKALRSRGKIHPVGELLTLTVKEFNWAEYGQADYCGDGVFLAEEWRMQIVG